LTFAGTETSEGQLLLSTDGRELTFAGYNAPVGQPLPGNAPAATFNRVIGIVGVNGVVDTSTAVSSGTSGTAISAITDNGTHFWLASSVGGVGYVSAGAATQLSTTPSNVRVLGIFGNQLYVTSASGTVQGVASIGSGLPTTSGQTTTLLPGFPTATGPSPYDFAFDGASTLYVADDRASASGGGIQKWTLSAGTWSLAYTLVTEAGQGSRSLTIDTSGANPIIYAVTTETTANKIVAITDSGTGLDTGVAIDTASANTVYRGLSFAPSVAVVPEPTTLALALSGGLAGLVLLRRRKS
jgi:hypothetical protein